MIKERKTKTKEFESEILCMYSQGVCYNDICETLNISLPTIRKLIVKKFGKQHEYRQKSEYKLKKENILQQIRSGVSFKSISNQFGITRQRAQQLAKEIGIFKNLARGNNLPEMSTKIKQDIEDGLTYDEIMNKYSLNYHKLNILGLKKLRKTFQNKRDDIIVEKFKLGMTAEQIIRDDDKFLNGSLKLNVPDAIYIIVGRRKVYRYENIRNRQGGGNFESPEIIEFIVKGRDERKDVYRKIVDDLNNIGKRTISGKLFTTYNAQMKYAKFKKDLKK